MSDNNQPWRMLEDTTEVVPGLMTPPNMPYWTKQILDEDLCDKVFHQVIEKYASKLLSLVYTADGKGVRVDRDSRYTHYYSPLSLKDGAFVDNEFNKGVAEAAAELWGGFAQPVYSSQVLGYEERCKFGLHCDNSIPDNGSWRRNDLSRDLTGLLYLTDWSEHSIKPGQFSGGELVLNNLVNEDNRPIIIRPKKGQLVVIPSHPVYRHSVPQITEGYRVAFVNWWKFSSTPF